MDQQEENRIKRNIAIKLEKGHIGDAYSSLKLLRPHAPEVEMIKKYIDHTLDWSAGFSQSQIDKRLEKAKIQIISIGDIKGAYVQSTDRYETLEEMMKEKFPRQKMAELAREVYKFDPQGYKTIKKK